MSHPTSVVLLYVVVAMEFKICVVLFLGYAVLPLLAQETVSIDSFSVEQTTSTVRITLTLSSPVNVQSGCFFDKVTFVNADDATTFIPRNPGSCSFTSAASSNLTGTMDVDDFISSFQFMLFTELSSSSIVIGGSSAVLLVPGVLVNPISSPMQPASFTRLTVAPALVAFDLDVNTLLLHFNGLMDSTTFRPELLMLSATSSSQTQVPLTSSSQAVGTPRYTSSLCLTLTPMIQGALQTSSICGNTSACFCNVSSGSISSYLNVPVSESSLVPATIIRTSATAPSSPVFLQLSLTYSSCSAQHYMMEDEVFVLRPFESVSRIECFTNDDANSSNIQPQIFRGPSSVGNLEVGIEDYVGYSWPLSTYLSFAGGMPPQLYGQYICRSASGHHARNYIHDDNFAIELSNGANYQVPLFNMLVIPFYLGSYPRTDLTQPSTTISLFDMRGANIPTTFDRVNPFHVKIRFDMVPQSFSNGSYEIRVLSARASIVIEVTAPTLTLRPEVVTIAPGQDEIVLQCLPNSDSFLLSWMSGSSGTSLSSENTLRESVPPRSSEYTCSVRVQGSDVVLASATVPVRNVQGNLNVWRGAAPVENNSLIDDRSGSVSLQCFETVETNLSWVILPDNGSLAVLTPGKTDIFTVADSGNQAILNVEGVFSGLIKCLSLNDSFNIRIIVGGGRNLQTCEEEADSVWNVQWNETLSGRRDFQRCPVTSGSPTRGFVLRHCHEGGVWNETVDISDCSTESFESLKDFAENTVIRLRRAYSSVQLNESVTQIISRLRSITRPKPTTLFPKDLDLTNDILVGLLDLLMEESLPGIHVGIIDVLDNLLHENNTDGWQLLTEMNDGSQLFFNISDAFGRYLLESLGSDQNDMTISRVNIIYSAMVTIPSQGIMFPQSLTSREAQITLPPSVLDGATGVVHVAMNNLNAILPRPSSPPGGGISRIIASNIVSSQVRVASGYISNFNSSQVVTLEFLTEATARAADPVCLSWDAPSGDWLDTGIETIPPIEEPEAGEFKVFSIRCSSDHLGAFGAAINVSTSADFDLSIPVIIGCACVIFSSTLSLFALLLSWIFDSLRRYSLVAFAVHLSFVFSVMCAFLTFLVGIQEALDHMIGCVAVAGLLQYFFTAAFSWLLCEVLLLLFFSAFSQHCGSFVLLFIIGWGLPAIPTAVSLGILHGDYGTSTHCWFFFDGQVSSEVVLGFIIPKLIIVGVTLLLIPVGCITNCKFSKEKVQPYNRAKVTCILWFIWTSILLFLVSLALSWVFAVLLVNVYGLDSDVSGWIFMAAGIFLSLWMFIFSATLMVTNQKVDYERLWSSTDPTEPPTDPASREKGYHFMEMPSIDLTGRRTSTLTRSPPSIISDPGFGLHHH